MITASHHMCKPIALLFGSCEDVDDDTDNETNNTKAGKHHPDCICSSCYPGSPPSFSALSQHFLSFLPFFFPSFIIGFTEHSGTDFGHFLLPRFN